MAVPGERSLSRWLPWAALAAFAVCTQLWVESEWRPGWDSALHILTAQSLRAGQGYSYLDQPFTLRPPGLSWLLSFLLSEGPLNAPLLNRVMMALAASSAAALYFALSRVAGQWPALGIALLFGTSLAEVQLFNTIASEHPFATLLFLGAGWLEVARRRASAGWVWALAAAAALAAAVYMRSAALLAVPAVAVVALRGPPRARRHAWIAVFVIALLVSPWIWHTHTVGASLPPSDQLLLSDYVTATLRVDPGDPASAWVSPAGWLQRIRSNGGRMLIDLGQTVLNVGTLPVGGILAALSLAGIALAGRRRPSVFEGFAILYTLLLLTYFTYETRLLFPLVPLVYYYLFVTLDRVGTYASERSGRRWFRVVLPAAGFALAMVVNLATLPRNLDPSGSPRGKKLAAIWRDVRTTADWIREHTAPEDVILCDWAPIYGVMTGRRAYSYRFSDGLSLLERLDPDYVIVESLGRASPALRRRLVSRSVERWVLPSQLPRARITAHRLGRPNVLIVVVDSLRADHLAAYGYSRNTSPFLDEFARRGARFTQAYSHSSHTKLSVASMFTGLTPPRHGLRSAELKGEKRMDTLSEAAHTLAETFKAAGYATAGFVANPHLKRKQGFAQGFETYLHMPAKETRAEKLNEEALAWLAGTESPFFLYLHYMDVHFPYDPPPPYRTFYSEERPDLTPLRLLGPGRFDRETIEYSMALYDGEINYWDDRFRQFIEAMERAGQMDNTVVVVVADHGEEFGEHAGFGHGFTAYSEVLHVPLVVVYERGVAPGVVREDLVRLIDLAPTLRSLAGLAGEATEPEGSDLFASDVVDSPDSNLHTAVHTGAYSGVYSETFRGREPRSLRTSRHQLIYNASDGSWEFYQLDSDPRTLRDVMSLPDGFSISRDSGDAHIQRESALRTLRAELQKRMSASEGAAAGDSIELDDETIEQLEGLGYLQ